MKSKNRKVIKIKLIISLIFTLFFNLMFSQIDIPSDYLKIPDSLFFKDHLYQSIIPNKKYKYWKVVQKYSSMEKLVYEKKKITGNNRCKENHSIESGFFEECMPDGCFSYIVSCNNKTIEYFTTENELIKFIDYVDNLSEALLIAKTYGLWFDRKNPVGGSFKMDKDFIYLNLAKFKRCPVSSESFYVRIDRKTGELYYESKGIYHKTNDCYSS